MPSEFETVLQITEAGVVFGYVLDPRDLSRRFTVDILVDGLPVAVLRATAFWDGDLKLTLGDGCYAFYWSMPESVAERARTIEARLANSEYMIGHLSRDEAGFPCAPPSRHRGAARWPGGLVIRGWVPRSSDSSPPRVSAWIEGQVVADALCQDWETVELAGRLDAVPAFTLRLPTLLADGCARSVDVIGPDGQPLVGSPLAIIAFQDSLADLIETHATFHAERVRARFADALLPQSLPFSAIVPWLERVAATQVALGPPTRAGIALAGTGDEHKATADFTSESIALCQVHRLTGGTTTTSFRTEDLERLLERSDPACDLFIFTLAGSRLRSDALACFEHALVTHTESKVAYADILLNDVHGLSWPVAWPAFDRERWLEQGFAALCFAVRRTGVARAIASRAHSLVQVFDAQCDSFAPPNEPVHVPRPLAHLPPLPVADLTADLIVMSESRRNMTQVDEARRAAALPLVRICRPLFPARITAVLACCNHGLNLKATIADLQNAGRSNELEILIVDNHSTEPDTLRVLADLGSLGCRIVRESDWFKPAKLLNRGAAMAANDLLLFLEPGISFKSGTDLDELVERVQQDDVGAVAPLLIRESGLVAHAGYVLGPPSGVSAPFRDRFVDSSGYTNLLDCAHQRSAVSAACLLTKRREFQHVGGFDAVEFPLHVYDVDYCLKLRAGGRRIIVTPHAHVCLAASISGDIARPGPGASTRDHELSRLQHRWDLLTTCDPYYSPWLNTDGLPYSGLNWFPQSIATRQSIQKHGRVLIEGF